MKILREKKINTNRLAYFSIITLLLFIIGCKNENQSNEIDCLVYDIVELEGKRIVKYYKTIDSSFLKQFVSSNEVNKDTLNIFILDNAIHYNGLEFTLTNNDSSYLFINKFDTFNVIVQKMDIEHEIGPIIFKSLFKYDFFFPDYFVDFVNGYIIIDKEHKLIIKEANILPNGKMIYEKALTKINNCD